MMTNNLTGKELELYTILEYLQSYDQGNIKEVLKTEEGLEVMEMLAKVGCIAEGVLKGSSL